MRAAGRSRGFTALGALLVGGLPALLGACAGAPAAGRADPPVAGPTPLLWCVCGRGPGRAFLFGSIHLGRSDGELRLGSAVERAFREAQTLVVEVDLNRIDPDEVAAFVGRRAQLPDSVRIDERIPTQTARRLHEYFARRSIPFDAFARKEPWFVAITILQLEVRRAGFDPDRSVDRLLLQRARGHKTIGELETFEEQITLLDEFGSDVQQAMLEDVLYRLDDFDEELERLLRTWRLGDAAGLEAIVFEELERRPELGPYYAGIFFERNRRMAQRIEQKLAEPDTRFVVVGAGHLVGARGIPALMRERGLEVHDLRAAAPGEVAAACR